MLAEIRKPGPFQKVWKTDSEAGDEVGQMTAKLITLKGPNVSRMVKECISNPNRLDGRIL